jgi:hypothetical protein
MDKVDYFKFLCDDGGHLNAEGHLDVFDRLKHFLTELYHDTL